MKKLILFIMPVLFYLFTSIRADVLPDPRKRLQFMLGEWDCVSVDFHTGEKSTGYSDIRWAIGKTWLQWKFTSYNKKGSLEVLTLINHHQERKAYAFYSFNPFDTEPLPHYGNWIDAGTLRLKINTGNHEIWVDFKVEGSGKFIQIHKNISPDGKIVFKRKTVYTKKRQ